MNDIKQGKGGGVAGVVGSGVLGHTARSRGLQNREEFLNQGELAESANVGTVSLHA